MKNIKNSNSLKRLLFAAAAFTFVVGTSVISFISSSRLTPEEPDTTPYYSFEKSPVEAEKNDIRDERYDETTKEKTTKEKEPITTVTEAQPQTKAVSKSFVLPSDGDIIKDFSPTVPVFSKTMEDWRVHNGVDFAAAQGDKAYAVGYGKVSRIYADSKWGYVIEVDYGDFILRYCGISQDGAVSIDEAVSPGGIIGEAAPIPAEEKDGLHFHIEAIKDGKIINPLEAIKVR